RRGRWGLRGGRATRGREWRRLAAGPRRGCRAGAGLTRPGAVPRVQPAVPIVGLTGGMGAGKSTALEALRRLGAATLSTDEVVHELLATEPVRAAVINRFGEQVAPAGVVDRAAVAAAAFATDADRAWL